MLDRVCQKLSYNLRGGQDTIWLKIFDNLDIVRDTGKGIAYCSYLFSEVDGRQTVLRENSIEPRNCLLRGPRYCPAEEASLPYLALYRTLQSAWREA